MVYKIHHVLSTHLSLLTLKYLTEKKCWNILVFCFSSQGSGVIQVLLQLYCCSQRGKPELSCSVFAPRALWQEPSQVQRSSEDPWWWLALLHVISQWQEQREAVQSSHTLHIETMTTPTEDVLFLFNVCIFHCTSTVHKWIDEWAFYQVKQQAGDNVTNKCITEMDHIDKLGINKTKKNNLLTGLSFFNF